MCGYCTELYALYAIAAKPSDPFTAKVRLRGYGRTVLIQEAQNPGAFLDGIERPPDTAESVVWLGRALQILTDDGFDSPAYREWLAVPRFRVAVNLHCRGAKAQTSAYATSSLDVASLGWLVERETWHGPGVFARRASEVSRERCEFLLAQYGASCFPAAGESSGEAVEDGVTSTAPSRSELGDQFDNWLLPLMLAVSEIAQRSCPDEVVRRALWPLVCNQPAWMPQFEALELWLQRQATLAVYDRFGIAPFADNLYSLRPELFQYLGLTGRIDARERGRLLEAFLQHGTRGDGNFFSLHHWLVEGDLQQSLTSFAQ